MISGSNAPLQFMIRVISEWSRNTRHINAISKIDATILTSTFPSRHLIVYIHTTNTYAFSVASLNDAKLNSLNYTCLPACFTISNDAWQLVLLLCWIQ